MDVESVVIDLSVQNRYRLRVARPREFDRDAALQRAMAVFWARGFASASTRDLLRAMKIGRQSMYDSFGDKRQLYLEALAHYQHESVGAHLERLRSRSSPIAGLEALLLGVVAEDEAVRKKGCMGVAAIAEFGSADPQVAALGVASGKVLRRAVVERLEAARAAGEIRKPTKVEAAADFVTTTMQGLQVGARAGMTAPALREVVAMAMAAIKHP
jgi:AcrR family transcriptional regulator